MSSKTITVAVVSYGYGHLIGHCLDSVLSQTRKPDDIVAVDDGADDGACEIAEKYGIRTVKRPVNLGVIDNFNDILYNQISTERVIFLGADNWLHPECLEVMDAHSDHDIVTCDLFVTGSEWRDFRGLNDPDRIYWSDGYPVRRFRQREDFLWKMRRASCLHGSSLYNVNLARQVGGYAAKEGKKRTEEDHVLFSRMLEAGGTAFAVERPLVYYRRHKSNFYRY